MFVSCHFSCGDDGRGRIGIGGGLKWEEVDDEHERDRHCEDSEWSKTRVSMVN